MPMYNNKDSVWSMLKMEKTDIKVWKAKPIINFIFYGNLWKGRKKK